MSLDGPSDLLKERVHGWLRASGFGLKAWTRTLAAEPAKANLVACHP
jgi:hypothetical protein